MRAPSADLSNGPGPVIVAPGGGVLVVVQEPGVVVLVLVVELVLEVVELVVLAVFVVCVELVLVLVLDVVVVHGVGHGSVSVYRWSENPDDFEHDRESAHPPDAHENTLEEPSVFRHETKS